MAYIEITRGESNQLRKAADVLERIRQNNLAYAIRSLRCCREHHPDTRPEAEEGPEETQEDA